MEEGLSRTDKDWIKEEIKLQLEKEREWVKEEIRL